MEQGLSAKEVAADQRIVALIERYEQLCMEDAEEIEVEDKLSKQKRSQVLDGIIEEVNEVYGCSDDEDDS